MFTERYELYLYIEFWSVPSLRG